ncbi:MAG: sulfotransferase domain-containing protein, partial [Spirochaetaceae bacterium]
MIVFCVGMIRSGSTLQYQIVSELIEKCGFGRSIGWVPPEKIDTIIDASYDDSNFIVVKSHDVTNKMLSLSKEKVKFFYIYRDIRDVTVSAMRQFNWSFEESIDHLSWSLDIHNKIEKCSDHDIYISKYEEVFNNLRSEVRSISQYLGVNASEDIIESITNNLSIESQKEKVKKFKSKHDSLIENPDNEGDFVDTKTQLHINHINKGKINGFLDILTKEQVLFLNLKFYTWLYIHEYQIDDHDLKPLFEDAIKKYIITSNSNLELRNKVQELL